MYPFGILVVRKTCRPPFVLEKPLQLFILKPIRLHAQPFLKASNVAAYGFLFARVLFFQVFQVTPVNFLSHMTHSHNDGVYSCN